MKPETRDRAEGTAKQIKGKMKEEIGKWAAVAKASNTTLD